MSIVGSYNIVSSKDISNSEIYQLYSDAWVSMEDIMFSVSNKEEYNKSMNGDAIVGDDGRKYVNMSEQYNSYEKIQDILSNYYTKEYLPVVMDDFSAFKTMAGKLVAPADGNVGISFYDTKKVLTNRQNIDNDTIQANYNEYGAETGVFMDTITVTLSFENNSWKVSNIQYIDK